MAIPILSHHTFVRPTGALGGQSKRDNRGRQSGTLDKHLMVPIRKWSAAGVAMIPSVIIQ